MKAVFWLVGHSQEGQGHFHCHPNPTNQIPPNKIKAISLDTGLESFKKGKKKNDLYMYFFIKI